jgi:regulator of replication initiation timing
LQELKNVLKSKGSGLQKTLLDPAVNVMFEDMRQEVQRARNRVDEMQSELSAWKFTPDSNTGKRLMAKCRLLYQENEELGRVVSSGRIAKLESDLALQKSFSDEMKKSQAELDEFLFELDEDVEGMQSTIYYLQQQLRDTRDQVQKLQVENEQLKTNVVTESAATNPTTTTSAVQDAHDPQVVQDNLVEPGAVEDDKMDAQPIDSDHAEDQDAEHVEQPKSDDESSEPKLTVENGDKSFDCDQEEPSIDQSDDALSESRDEQNRKRLCDLKPDIGGGIDSIIRKHRRLEIRDEHVDS